MWETLFHQKLYYIILYYAENQIYRICTNLDRYQAETIFKKDKEGSLSKETIYKFLNS